MTQGDAPYNLAGATGADPLVSGRDGSPPGWPRDPDARRALERLQQVNARDVAAARSLATVLASGDGSALRSAAGALRASLRAAGRGDPRPPLAGGHPPLAGRDRADVREEGDRAPRGNHDRRADLLREYGAGERLSLPSTGASAVLALLRMHPAFGRRSLPDVVFDLSRRQSGAALEARRADAAEVLALGCVALGTSDAPAELYAGALAHLAFGADDASVLLRQALLGDPPHPEPGIPRAPAPRPRPGPAGPEPEFLPQPLPLPADVLQLGERVRGSCLEGVLSSAIMAASARWAAKFSTWSGGIAGIAPASGCAGTQVTITGTGFGDPQPADVGVLFPGPGGSVTFASVVSWSDTEIVVVAPPGVGRGCVGFYRLPAAGAAAGARDAAGQLGDELLTCLGQAAAGPAERLSGALRLLIESPPCLPDSANRFDGGPPEIDSFTVDSETATGTRTRIDLRPDTALTLRWSVRGATSVEIQPIQPAGVPDALPPIPGPFDPVEGSATTAAVPETTDWEGEYELRAWNACTGAQPVTRRVQVRMRRTIAFALSGGGAKGDFQVGALRYLYDVKGLRPHILTGTSVGAVNAAKLAEGDDPLTAASPQHAQRRLELIWRSLQRNEDMYVAEPWLRNVGNLNLQRLTFTLLSSPFAAADILYDLPVAGMLEVAQGLQRGDYGQSELVGFLNQFINARAIFNLSPIEALLLDPATFDEARVRASGITLRLVSVSLETGEIVEVTEEGRILASGGGTASLVDAVIASAAIPVVFPPRAVGAHTCVDGGVREVLPLRSAVELGATHVYAIRAGGPPSPGVAPASVFPITQIGKRAVLDWMVEEVTLNDVEPYRGWPPGVIVDVIQPTFDVNNTTQIEPGLIDIAMDYGFMRACEGLDAPEQNRASMHVLSDRITRLRMDAWYLEHSVNREPVRPAAPGDDEPAPLVAPVPDSAGVLLLRGVKQDIRVAADQWRTLGGTLPPTPERWWQGWERHWFPVDYPSPWSEIYTYQGWVPAAAPPSPL